MKTLYISDLDGTLLNSKSQLSEATKKGLNKLIDTGALFSIATARTPGTVVKIFEGVNIKLPMVLMTGALTFDMYHKRYTDIRTFSDSTTNRIIDILEENNLSTFIYTVENHHLNVFYKGITNALEQKFIDERTGSGYKTFYLTKDYYCLCGKIVPVLFFIMGDFNKVTKASEIISKIPGISSFCYRDIFDKTMGYLEIFSESTSKADAIKKLAESLGVDRLVTFGDNLNDIPMFNISDECYAMKNAFPEVKAAATATIDSNDDDGVIKFLMERNCIDSVSGE